MEKKKPYEYKHWKEVRAEMNKIVSSKTTLPKKGFENESAFVTRNGNSKSSYKIYISPFAAGKSSYIHECGHIIFQHLRFEELQANQVKAKIKAVWNRIEKFVEYDIKDFDAKSRTLDNLIHIMSNYAMDMEVNSKLFDEDEKDRVNFEATKEEYDKLKYIYETTYDTNAKLRIGKILKDFSERRKKNPKELLASLVFPEEFSYPRKLHWLQYIDLIVTKPEEAMKRIAERLANETSHKRPSSLGKGGNPSSNGNPNGKGGQLNDKVGSLGKNGNPLHGNGTIKASDIDELAKSLDNAENNPEMKNQIEEAFSEENDWQSSDRQTGGGFYNGRVKQMKVSPLGKEVEKFIQERILEEFKDMRSDFLYNYNRGKTGNLMRSKTIEHTDFYMGNCYVIVDTSGSIGAKQLNQAVMFFQKIQNFVGPDSKVIWFGTEVQRIDKFRNIKDAPRGWGNDMVAALQFVGKHVRKEDRVFMISDFYDDPPKIGEEIDKLKCAFYGIKWVPSFRMKGKTLEKSEYEYMKPVLDRAECIFVSTESNF